jgi:FtsH-binding integral membrane protein
MAELRTTGTEFALTFNSIFAVRLGIIRLFLVYFLQRKIPKRNYEASKTVFSCFAEVTSSSEVWYGLEDHSYIFT